MKNKQQIGSFLAVIAMALILPTILKNINIVTRNIVGAEGRLAALTIEVDRDWGPLQKNWVTTKNFDDEKTRAAELVAENRAMLNQDKSELSPVGPGETGPALAAIELLSNLGDERIGVSGEGSFVSAIASKSENGFQVIVVNRDIKNKHNEAVPINFIKLPKIKYALKVSNLEGILSKKLVTATQGIIQEQIYMTPNDVALVELIPEN